MMVFGYKLYKEMAGIFSENPIWVFIDSGGYLYTHESLIKLIYLVITEWQHDKHLVGYRG